MAIKGIDVSHHQGEIDYRMIKENHPEIKFVIAKATEGISFVDSMFDRNMSQCREFGLLRGAYHYVRGDLPPVTQAMHFCSVVKDQNDPSILLALDVEDSTLTNMRPRDVADIVEIMAGEIFDALQTFPLIYVSRAFMSPNMFKTLGELCGGWIASWGGKTPHRSDLNTSIWQYTSKGRVSGIRGDVDMDIAYITPQNWLKFANPEGRRL